MNILIRTDSSSTIGTGHIMRDLVLASQYKYDTIIFATQNLPGNINHKIIESNYQLSLLESNSISELNNLIKQYKINMLIIDHYDIDYTLEMQLKNLNPHLTIMVLDDTYEKHYCDILLNHNISSDKKKYHTLVPHFCELRCGNQYTLLRDEFKKEKRKKKTKNSQIKILIAMGGADTAQLNIPILKILKNFTNISTTVVTTTANQELEKLKNYCKYKKWVNLQINTNHMATLMAQSNFAIVTPSVTINEVYFMNLPFIAIKTASNQEDIYQFLHKKKFFTMKQFNTIKLKKYIKAFIS